MTDERQRMPMAVRAPGRARTLEGSRLTAAPRHFAESPASSLSVPPAVTAAHPTFEQRAAIWRDHRAGVYTLAEAMRRSSLVGTPERTPSSTPPKKPEVRPRHTRSAPASSRQYSGEMATTAARDDRLTPNAKAFLQILRARCGKGRVTEMTKATLGNVMARSARTIRRYLVDLEAHGYIRTETRKDRRGLHTGLRVWICDKVLAFFEETRGLAAWLAETRPLAELPFAVETPGIARVTKLSPINLPINLSSRPPVDFAAREGRKGRFSRLAGLKFS